MRDELLDPKDPTNQQSRVKTIEYLEVQVKGGLRKMLDPKLALKQNLEVADVLARADTISLDATNDRLAESIFGCWDYILRRNPGITMEAASALVQAMRNKPFAEGGALDQLPEKEAIALFEMARLTLPEMRKIDHAHHTDHDAYVTAKRKSNSQLELTALVKQYALALSFFKRWKQRGVKSPDAAKEELAGIDSAQKKLDWLREQIEMRTVGLGFNEFKTAWSSGKDEDVGSFDDLFGLLRDILMEERERSRDGTLPEAAVVPQMRRKTFKELGTPTVQATELGDKVISLPAAELLERATAERARMVAAGEIDDVAEEQPQDAPPIGASLIGTELDIRWRYWVPVNDPKDKRSKKACDIWCTGEVVQIANGTSDTGTLNQMTAEKVTCRKLLDAGAVRIKWPADLDREVPEPESWTWVILEKAGWNADAVMGWRFATAELKKRSSQQAAPKRRRREE